VTKVPVVLPITSGGDFARTAGFAVPLTGAGTKTTGVVRCDQPRALDLGAREGKKLESVPDEIMDEVLAAVEILSLGRQAAPVALTRPLWFGRTLNVPRNGVCHGSPSISQWLPRGTN